MTDAAQQSHNRIEIIVPVLFIGAMITILLGITSLAIGSFRAAGLPLLFGGLGALAFAQLFELLSEIAGHLAAIRAQMNKGVLGLLG